MMIDEKIDAMNVVNCIHTLALEIAQIWQLTQDADWFWFSGHTRIEVFIEKIWVKLNIGAKSDGIPNVAE